MTSAAASTVEVKAARGVAWGMALSIATRALSVVGTLVLTYYLDRQVMGEVTNAAIVVTAAVQVAMLGVPQFLVTRKTIDRATTWHATVLVVVSMTVALGLLLLFSEPLCVLLKAPGMARYLPGLALATFLVSLAILPERLAQRNLQFKRVSQVRGARELTYTASSVGLAAAGWGGLAVVGGNLARSLVHLGLMFKTVRAAEWLTPHRLSLATFRKILAFGLPLMTALIAGTAARSWDNLVISGMYGAAAAGAYNLAYNLADIPATQVGEHITDVLMPSLSRLGLTDRRQILLRATALVSLLVFPLAVGIGVVAPTLVATFLRPEWAPVGPMLTVLSALAVVRPLGWTAGAYLAASNRPKTVMWLSILNVVALFASMAVLGYFFGPLWACAGVGLGFGIHAAAAALAVSRFEDIPIAALVRPIVPPLLACAVMAAAVLGVRSLMQAAGLHVRGLSLAVEIAVGGGVYLAAAWLLARGTVRELLSLVRRARLAD